MGLCWPCYEVLKTNSILNVKINLMPKMGHPTHHGVELSIEVEAIRSEIGSIRSSCRGVRIQSQQSRHNLDSKVGVPVLGGQAAQLGGVVVPHQGHLGQVVPRDAWAAKGEGQVTSPTWLDHVVELARHERLGEDNESAGHGA